jgi:hypothetical protein
MPAGREAPALDDRDFVRHVGVLGIVGDTVDPALRDNLAGRNSCAIGGSCAAWICYGNRLAAAMFRRSYPYPWQSYVLQMAETNLIAA